MNCRVVAAMVVLFAHSSWAGTVNITINSLAGTPDALFLTSTNAQLTSANYEVELGYFGTPTTPNPAEEAIIAGSDRNATEGIFTALGDTTGAHSSSGSISINDGDGSFAGLISVDNVSLAVGTRLYLWIKPTGPPSPTDEWGIVSLPAWDLPAGGDLFPAPLLVAPGQIVDQSGVQRGTFAGGVDPIVINLAQVPEPSTFLLGIFGFGLFFLRRRR